MIEYKAYTVSRGGIVRYVGVTKMTIQKRWRYHVYASKTGSLIIHKAIRRHGAAAFVIDHVASSWGADGIHEIERILIAEYGTCGGRGYNAMLASRPAVFSDEARRRMSRKAIETHAHPDVRRKMSESATRRFSTAEGKAAQSRSQRARWTPEARAEQAARAAAQMADPARRQAHSALMKTRSHFADPDKRAVFEERRLAGIRTDAARKKKSDSQRRRLEDPIEFQRRVTQLAQALAIRWSGRRKRRT